MMRTWAAPRVPTLPRAGEPLPVLVHDSSTGNLVEAAPGSEARLYACGITPYDATHLGHANTYLTFDLLYRAWLDAGKRVTYASNVTDVDDPLLERARLTGVDWQDLAAEQTELFRTDMAALRMLPPDSWTGAVASIPWVVEAVTAMLDAGAAYRVDRDVYADLTCDPDFGTVAHFGQAQMLADFAERGGDPGRPGKRHPLDPLLWRGAVPGDPSWPGGVLGDGRPGWHIECAVIARNGLGLPFDVQGGGVDLLFPHHEMSSSHARFLGGSAHVHLHTGLLAYGGHKMSKSLGNLVFVSRLRLSAVDSMVIRLALLSHHYRAEWEWTSAELVTAHERLAAWRNASQQAGSASGRAGTVVLEELRAAMATDLDAPRALAAVDRWATEPGPDAAVAVAAIDALLGVTLEPAA